MSLALVQPSLPFEPAPVPPMRRAYETTTLAKQGITYPQALSKPLVRQALECQARAMEKRRTA